MDETADPQAQLRSALAEWGAGALRNQGVAVLEVDPGEPQVHGRLLPGFVHRQQEALGLTGRTLAVRVATAPTIAGENPLRVQGS